MAHRIEPFRDYSEHEVINLFALNIAELVKLNADGNAKADCTLADMKNLSGGQFDSGVVVGVDGSTLNGSDGAIPGQWDKNADMRAYLGHDHVNAHIGWNAMPSNPLTVKPVKATEAALGITLRQTLAYDENGENLLRYPVKKDELQAVGPGETVPVLTRGLVILNADAFAAGAAPIANQGLALTTVADDDATAADAGKLKGANDGTLGICLAIDSGADKKYLCKLSF